MARAETKPAKRPGRKPAASNVRILNERDKALRDLDEVTRWNADLNEQRDQLEADVKRLNRIRERLDDELQDRQATIEALKREIASLVQKVAYQDGYIARALGEEYQELREQSSPPPEVPIHPDNVHMAFADRARGVKGDDDYTTRNHLPWYLLK